MNMWNFVFRAVGGWCTRRFVYPMLDSFVQAPRAVGIHRPEPVRVNPTGLYDMLGLEETLSDKITVKLPGQTVGRDVPMVVKEPLCNLELRQAEAVSTMPIELPGVVRLRRRSGWAEPLRLLLGLDAGYLGAFLRGRWKPDLPSEHAPGHVRFLSALVKSGVKVVGSGLVRCELTKSGQHPGKEEEQRHGRPMRYTVLALGGEYHTVVPELVASLSSLALFRARDSALISLLRLRALEWCKSRGVTAEDAVLCIPSSIALAALVSGPEAAAVGLLDSRAMAGKVTFPWVKNYLGSGWWRLRT